MGVQFCKTLNSQHQNLATHINLIDFYIYNAIPSSTHQKCCITVRTLESVGTWRSNHSSRYGASKVNDALAA